jgi:hypothetical protein
MRRFGTISSACGRPLQLEDTFAEEDQRVLAPSV